MVFLRHDRLRLPQVPVDPAFADLDQKENFDFVLRRGGLPVELGHDVDLILREALRDHPIVVLRALVHSCFSRERVLQRASFAQIPL